MYPHEFSGGMRQRAMIAMAMANDPDVVIADEPTTALDVTVQAQVLEVLNEVKDEFNSAIILITHDLGVVAGMADRVMVMYAGRAGRVRRRSTTIYEQPRMPYTLGLLGVAAPARLRRHRAPGADPGRSPPSLLNLPPGCPFQPRCPLAARAVQRGRAGPAPDRDERPPRRLPLLGRSCAGDVAPEEMFEITADDSRLVAEFQAESAPVADVAQEERK